MTLPKGRKRPDKSLIKYRDYIAVVYRVGDEECVALGRKENRWGLAEITLPNGVESKEEVRKQTNLLLNIPINIKAIEIYQQHRAEPNADFAESRKTNCSRYFKVTTSKTIAETAEGSENFEEIEWVNGEQLRQALENQQGDTIVEKDLRYFEENIWNCNKTTRNLINIDK